MSAAKHCSMLFLSGQNRLFIFGWVHSKKRTTCSGLMKTALKNVLLPTLFKVVNNTEQVDEPELACNQVLNNIVNNLEQCVQQNIVQCCFHQARTGCAFFAVYADLTSGISHLLKWLIPMRTSFSLSS